MREIKIPYIDYMAQRWKALYFSGALILITFVSLAIQGLNFGLDFTGGTVVHAFLGESIQDPQMAKAIVRKISDNYHLPYFSLTPTFSICPIHGYIPGSHKYCPYEHSEEDLAQYGISVQDSGGRRIASV